MASFLLSNALEALADLFQPFSSLSESGFIPTKSTVLKGTSWTLVFSSLSESGFIPTVREDFKGQHITAFSSHLFQRVASFLLITFNKGTKLVLAGSHLFQRVASFLQELFQQLVDELETVLISFREWLHSYFTDLAMMYLQD